MRMLYRVIACSEVGNGELWHSSIISKRIDSHFVETSSGSHYLLLGDLDSALARQNGQLLSFAIILHFVLN